MSISARNWALESEYFTNSDGVTTKLKAGEKWTLAILAEHENTKLGYAYPSIETLAAKTLHSRRTIISHLAVLEGCGALERGKARRSTKKYPFNIYYLSVDEKYREGDPEWMRAQG